MRHGRPVKVPVRHLKCLLCRPGAIAPCTCLLQLQRRKVTACASTSPPTHGCWQGRPRHGRLPCLHRRRHGLRLWRMQRQRCRYLRTPLNLCPVLTPMSLWRCTLLERPTRTSASRYRWAACMRATSFLCGFSNMHAHEACMHGVTTC